MQAESFIPYPPVHTKGPDNQIYQEAGGLWCNGENLTNFTFNIDRSTLHMASDTDDSSCNYQSFDLTMSVRHQGKDKSLLISDIENDLNSRTTIKKAKIEGVFTIIASVIAGIAATISSVLSSYSSSGIFPQADDSSTVSILKIAFIACTAISLVIAFLVKFFYKKDNNEK